MHELIDRLNHLTGSMTRDRRMRWGAWPVADYLESWGVVAGDVEKLIAKGTIRTHKIGRVRHITMKEHRRVLAMLERDELGAADERAA